MVVVTLCTLDHLDEISSRDSCESDTLKNFRVKSVHELG